MERRSDIINAKEIMGINFLGPDELSLVAKKIGIADPHKFKLDIPLIPYDVDILKSSCHDFILLLGVPENLEGNPLTLVSMRSILGIDPEINEPCFYNQDWYLNESFANFCSIGFRWYLLRRELIDTTRGKSVEIQENLSQNSLPSALLCAYAFFAYYFHSKNFLWPNDYVWCKDFDSNGDRIYVARYFDPLGVSKNGFSIHRHLKIRENYGCIEAL